MRSDELVSTFSIVRSMRLMAAPFVSSAKGLRSGDSAERSATLRVLRSFLKELGMIGPLLRWHDQGA
jgi:hypothetical protein